MKKFQLKCNVRKDKIYLYIDKADTSLFYVYVYDGEKYHRLKFKEYVCVEQNSWDKYKDWMDDFINDYCSYKIHILESVQELEEYVNKGKVAMKLSK